MSKLRCKLSHYIFFDINSTVWSMNQLEDERIRSLSFFNCCFPRMCFSRHGRRHMIDNLFIPSKHTHSYMIIFYRFSLWLQNYNLQRAKLIQSMAMEWKRNRYVYKQYLLLFSNLVKNDKHKQNPRIALIASRHESGFV